MGGHVIEFGPSDGQDLLDLIRADRHAVAGAGPQAGGAGRVEGEALVGVTVAVVVEGVAAELDPGGH